MFVLHYTLCPSTILYLDFVRLGADSSHILQMQTDVHQGPFWARYSSFFIPWIWSNSFSLKCTTTPLCRQQQSCNSRIRSLDSTRSGLYDPREITNRVMPCMYISCLGIILYTGSDHQDSPVSQSVSQPATAVPVSPSKTWYCDRVKSLRWRHLDVLQCGQHEVEFQTLEYFSPITTSTLVQWYPLYTATHIYE